MLPATPPQTLSWQFFLLITLVSVSVIYKVWVRQGRGDLYLGILSRGVKFSLSFGMALGPGSGFLSLCFFIDFLVELWLIHLKSPSPHSLLLWWNEKTSALSFFLPFLGLGKISEILVIKYFECLQEECDLAGYYTGSGSQIPTVQDFQLLPWGGSWEEEGDAMEAALWHCWSDLLVPDLGIHTLISRSRINYIQPLVCPHHASCQSSPAWLAGLHSSCPCSRN